MKILTRPSAVATLLIVVMTLMAFSNPVKKNQNLNTAPAPKIQVAILLDVSNSMDGLIDQARAQLWNMVSTMGKAKCDNAIPQIEIALYEYGRSTNDKAIGYVKQISPFTSDLDNLSKNLFGLTTNGGDEFCGHVIYTSMKELNWDPSPSSYKVIFIAGNEDFLQGDIHYTLACEEAHKKGVIVNTIYCGDKAQGISEHWNLGSECGGGSFTNINQDSKIEEIPTPYDSTIFALNDKLNGTYISYGYSGAGSLARQSEVDQLNIKMSKTVALERAAVKGISKLYDNTTWDLVDADSKDEKFLDKLDPKTLPDSLRNKKTEEIRKVVKEKSLQRSVIQQKITEISNKRENYIAAEKKKQAAKNNNATMETEVEKIIKEQARRHNMIIQ